MTVHRIPVLQTPVTGVFSVVNEPNGKTFSNPAVLLVEDSPDDVYFFRRALAKSRIECDLTHVSDGAAAVEWIQKAVSGRTLPDLIFLDLKMPVMSGFEVLEWLREHSYSDLLSVIVLSGSNEQADRDQAGRLGATDYLVKPIQSDDLKSRFTKFAKSGGEDE